MLKVPELSWIGKGSVSDDIQMYLPLLISLKSLVEKLDSAFSHLKIDYGMIISEILKEILKDDGYAVEGRAEKIVQLLIKPEHQNPEKDSLVLHECRILLSDIISDFIPKDCSKISFPYYYSHGDVFILYVPADSKTINSKEIRHKLVPYMALRFLDY